MEEQYEEVYIAIIAGDVRDGKSASLLCYGRDRMTVYERGEHYVNLHGWQVDILDCFFNPNDTTMEAFVRKIIEDQCVPTKRVTRTQMIIPQS